jgi:hypothetical protein
MLLAGGQIANAAILKTVVSCDVSSGADQSFTIEQTTDGFQLKELTAGGDMMTRDLEPEEIRTKTIQLGKFYKPDGGLNIVSQNADGSWTLTVTAGNMTVTETADCR